MKKKDPPSVDQLTGAILIILSALGFNWLWWSCFCGVIAGDESYRWFAQGEWMFAGIGAAMLTGWGLNVWFNIIIPWLRRNEPQPS